MTRSHKIGWIVLAAALLFVLWRLPRLHGQGFGSFSHDQPYLAKDRTGSTVYSPTNISGLAYWWVSTDMPLDTNMTYWVDRIQGRTNRPNFAVIQDAWPTNTSKGLRTGREAATATFCYTVNALTADTNRVIAMIFSLYADPEAHELNGLWTILDDVTSRNQGFILRANKEFRYIADASCFYSDYDTDLPTNNFSITVNTPYDFCHGFIASSDTNNNITFWDGGVYAITNTIAQNRMQAWNTVDGLGHTMVGYLPDCSGPVFSYIREILVWTNASPRIKDIAEELHNYRLQRYTN